MELKGIIYKGEENLDQETYDAVPEDLQLFYDQINGMVAYQGGLYIRGCVDRDHWNSLYRYWKGDAALHKSYAALTPSDIPFGQDCLGDQFFLRDGSVWALNAETATVEDLEMDFEEFIVDVIEDPVEFLSLEPLLHYLDAGNELSPGQILHCEPALTIEVPEGTDYEVQAMDIDERLKWLHDFSSKYQN
jgi:hypothetical protein